MNKGNSHSSKWILPLCFANFPLVLCLSIYVWYSNDLSRRIAYVDSNVLLEEYAGMKSARQAFQQKARVWQANIDTLQSEYKKTVDDYEKSKSRLSAKEEQLSQELIRTKGRQLQEYQQAIQQQSQQEDMQMTQKVLIEVNSQINEYAASKGYYLIFGASGSGNIIYAKEGLDITQEVIELLNKNYLGQ